MNGGGAAPTPLLFAAGEQRLAALDQLARRHWLGGLTHCLGSLEPRLDTLAQLRAGLVDGRVPAAQDWRWPDPAVAGPLHGLLVDLGLPRHCAGQRELADTLLASILFRLDFIVDYIDRGAGQAQAIDMALATLREDWQAHCGHLHELVEVFGRLPADAGQPRWDELLGTLQSSGWQQVLRIHRMLQRLPELARLIDALGRREESGTRAPQSPAPTPEQVSKATAAAHLDSLTVRAPELPGETRGVCRSDRIARMLPAEAMLLGHPRLRLVWHARRAERTLLSYEEDDHLREPRPDFVPQPLPQPEARAVPRIARGPILVCVDTSGSMQGAAEAVAKAVVLEAMRCAHAQGRACHLFAFGGPGELVERTLPVDADGIAGLAGFLDQGFHGGTDICGPLEAALARVEEARWRQADLLIASDGEFGATPAVLARLEQVRRDIGLRVQGVLVADRETIGFLAVADDIFPVREWRGFGRDGAPGSPIHSHRLTALYFPGALRGADGPRAAADPLAAAQAIRGGRTP